MPLHHSAKLLIGAQRQLDAFVGHLGIVDFLLRGAMQRWCRNYSQQVLAFLVIQVNFSKQLIVEQREVKSPVDASHLLPTQ